MKYQKLTLKLRWCHTNEKLADALCLLANNNEMTDLNLRVFGEIISLHSHGTSRKELQSKINNTSFSC